MNENGRKLAVIVGGYMIVKQLLNGIIGGFGGMNLFLLLFAAAAAICLWFGVKSANLIVAILLMLFACAYMPGNLRNVGRDSVYLLYILEGVLDMLGACMLAFHPDVREHCNMLKK